MHITQNLYDGYRAAQSNLRRHGTPTERILWNYLRKKAMGVRFRRQVKMGRFIVDFYASKGRLIIELDGMIHHDPAQKRYDCTRDEWLRSQRYRVLRFSKHDVEVNLNCVLECIHGHLNRKNPLPPLPIQY